MARWIQLAKADEIPSGRGVARTADDRRVALFRNGDRWHAMDEACPHQGASLADGAFHEGRVICPLHSWVFDAETGQCPRGTHEGVRVYPARREGDWIEIELP